MMKLLKQRNLQNVFFPNDIDIDFVAEATPRNLFEDIYVKGSEPKYMRGRILEENYSYDRPLLT
jgi:hypothetical protein